MMKSIAGESESPTEQTASPPISQRNSKSSQLLLKSGSGSTLRNAPPTPTKKSMQDLSASLQDFCRTHCCSLPPFRGRSEIHSAEEVGGTEPEALVGSQVQGLEVSHALSDDNLSLDETTEALSGKDEQRLSLTIEIGENVALNGNENASPTNGDRPKDARKGALRTCVSF